MKDSGSMFAFVPPWGSSFATTVTCAAVGTACWYLAARKSARPLMWQSKSDVESLLLEASQHQSEEQTCIYLDYNATTPVHPLVLAAMIPFLTLHFGNPSSSHYYGREPSLAIGRSRRSLLKLIGSTDAEDSIWFTGCGTESDNLAIQLALQSSGKAKKHIVTCNVEHPAIEACLKILEQQGQVEVSYVPVGKDGRVLALDMIAAIRSNTVLVTLMLANNESGALQPVMEVATHCRRRSILFHTDAAQAAGKVSVDLQELGNPDMMTLVGHKLGAPKGIAALYVRTGCLTEGGRKLPSGIGNGGVMLVGGGQEGGRRAGTENVPYIVGFGRAAELARTQLKQHATRMENLRNRLRQNLTSRLGDKIKVRLNGPDDPTLRLPNTLSVGLENIHSGELLENIKDQVAASAGAACHSGGSESVSATLRAMRVPPEFAAGTLRLSVGPNTTTEDVDTAAFIIAREARKQLQVKMPQPE